MNLAFATCDTKRARHFIQQVYPARQIDFDSEAVREVLSLIERDVVRVTDPSMHGKATIVESANYTEALRDEVYGKSLAMHRAIMAMPKASAAA